MATQSNGLVKQQLSIALTGGIDRKTDPKQLTNGQMYTADNVQYVTEKQCRKRFGYEVLNPPGGLQGAPFAAIGCRDGVEPIVLGTGALNRYNTQTGLSTYIPANTQGRVENQQVSSSSGLGTNAYPPMASSSASDGQKYVLVTWMEPQDTKANMYYGLQDLVTGAWILSPKLLSPPTNPFTLGSVQYTPTAFLLPRAMYNGQYFFISYVMTGSGTTGTSPNTVNVYASQLNFFTIDITNGQAGAVPISAFISLGSNFSNPQSQVFNYGFDIGINSGTMYVAIDTPSTSGTSTGTGVLSRFTISDQTITANGTASLTYAVDASSPVTRLTLALGGPSGAMAVCTGTSLVTVNDAMAQTARFDFTSPFSQTYQDARVTSCIWVGNIAYGFAPIKDTANASAIDIGVLAINFTTSALSSQGFLAPPSSSLRTAILSRPFIDNSKIYLWVLGSGYGGTYVYNSHILIELNPATGTANYVARTAYQVSGANVIRGTAVPVFPTDAINIPGTNKYVAYLSQTTDAVVAYTQTTYLNNVSPSYFYGTLNRTTFDFSPSNTAQIYNLPTGGNFIAGAFPLQYDGQSIVEAGFSSAPEFQTGTGGVSPLVTVATGSIPAGQYTWYACFVRRDAYGNVIRSAPSNAYIYSSSTVFSITFPPILYRSNANANVYIEYYRTTAANPNEPYFIGRVANGSAYTDSSTDNLLTGQPTLYTYSGELPNDPPPAVHSIAFGETRAYLIPSDARNCIWASKKYSPGRTVEWNSGQIITEGGTNSGQFTAVAVLDTNVIVFKADQILYFYGDGPDNTGASGSFSAFQRLSSDVGCIDPGSLAVIPEGVLFRSRRGIELLTRGLQVQYVGSPVEPIVQGIAAISVACVLPQYQQVRFISNVAGDPVLVFDYAYNRWSTYSGMSAINCANVLGNYWWVSQDGATCNVETPDQFTDNGNPITLTLETPEIPMSGIQGWGRLYRLGLLGEYKSPHTLLTSFAYDHAETYTDVVSYSAIDTVSASNLPPDAVFYDPNSNMKVDIVTAPCAEQFRMSRVPRQVMQTVRIKLQDQPYSAYYTSDGVHVGYTFYAGEGCAISNITLEVGQKAILAKLTGSKTV